MGMHYYKTCDVCGKTLVDDCNNVKNNPYRPYAVLTIRIMDHGKQFRQPTAYLCEECYCKIKLPSFGNKEK